MRRVLLYENRKVDPLVIDATTPEQQRLAFLFLFRHLRDEWEVYADLEEPLAWDEIETNERKLYRQACDGDALAAQRLLETRQDNNEFELWLLIDVVEPKASPK